MPCGLLEVVVWGTELEVEVVVMAAEVLEVLEASSFGS
jgi:hypothetical protein